MTQPPDGSEPLMPYDPGMPPPPFPAPAYRYPVEQKALGGVTTATSIMLAVTSALGIVLAFPLVNRANLIDKVLDGEVTESQLTSADRSVGTFLILQGLTMLVTAILFMIWQHGHGKNAVALGGRLGLGPGWAIGGWFIPLGNLVLPTLQIRQSARVSGPVPGVVAGWTISYVLAVATYAAGNWVRPALPKTRPADVKSFINKFVVGDYLTAGAMVVYAIAGVFAILMVRTLTRMQQEAFAGRQIQ